MRRALVSRIRVYELAKELGLSNKEALDLCASLGIAAKSHSSSIEEPQADRARRKADREGLRRSVAEEPVEVPAASATTQGPTKQEARKDDAGAPVSTVTSVKRSDERPATGDPTTVPPGPLVRASHDGAGGARAQGASDVEVSTDTAGVPAVPEAKKTRPSGTNDDKVDAAVTSHASAGASDRALDLASEPARSTTGKSADSRHQRPSHAGAQSGHRPPVPPQSGDRQSARHESVAGAGLAPHGPSGHTTATPSPAPAPLAPPQAAPVQSVPAAPAPPAPVATPAPRAPSAPTPSQSPTGTAVTSGPPRSLSGKPIPPPPGVRRPPPGSAPSRPGAAREPQGARTQNERRTTGFSGGGTGQRRFGGPGSAAPARPASPGTGAPGRFGASRPSAPGGAGPGGARPGAGGGFKGGGMPRGRQPQRRPRRRKRQLEELEPTQLTANAVSNAPVPDHEVIVERGCTAQELGPKLNRSAGDVVRYLLLQGEMVTATQSLTDEMIEIFAAEIGATVNLVDAGEEDEAALQAKYFGKDEDSDSASIRSRPAVVTVMGHVDHGKTLLLDRVREANVVDQEAGGITQHIGAYQVEVDGHAVTFIDTPGHEAFTAMRARGALVTDIVVLVVAADDGVMPQTVEAIHHAKAAGTPIVVALNKVDREAADPDRVRQQLSEHGLVPEAWGGDTIMVEVSALAKTGLDALLEQLLVVAEVEELKADPDIPARGVVLEANLDIGRGPVATVIVQAGTLRVGDYVVAGSAWGRVKALVNDLGDSVKEASPAVPARVLGFSKPPVAGDEFRVVADQGVARSIADARESRARHTTHLASVNVAPGTKLEDVFARIQSGEVSTLNLILKADVQGSLEAITDSLRKLESDEVKLDFIHRGVGGVTENDVQLAAASNAAVIGFNVRPDRRARELAEERRVEIRTYEVIYKVIEDLAAAMKGMLTPTLEEVVTGEAEVRAIFRVPRIGAVAGCMVRNGVITRGSKVRFLRDGVVIWKGAVTSLRRHKDDVREVATGFECGVGLSDFQDLHEGDIIETFEEREVEPVSS